MGKNKKKNKTKETVLLNNSEQYGEYGLPKEYLEGMKFLMGDEYEEFLEEYSKKPLKGLRFNKNKVLQETVDKLRSLWKLEPVPWCSDGYYYNEDADIEYPDGHTEKLRPGKSPYHAAGVFYIQEPSAMITAEKADIKSNELVLDLCAAPGGKSTQAAAKAGIIISNEIIPKRARILSSNIERMGLSNVIVTSAAPDELAELMPSFFDKIIVDAPCSGEGMMRRDETAVREWSIDNVKICINRQKDILEAADRMLKPGGKIIYSTCTFEPYENKWQMMEFVNIHPEYKLIEQEHMYPHKVKGEGHYCAVLKKDGEASGNIKPEEIEEKIEYLKKILKNGRIHVLRSGVEKGELIIGKYNGDLRYEPSHAEILAKSYKTCENAVNLLDEKLALSYLRGESIRLSDEDKGKRYEIKGEDGFIAVCYDGYTLGLGKKTEAQIKNHYPKGLRFIC